MLAALVCVPGTPTTTPSAQADDPVRIMFVGDSITQGSEGDWTFRYRVWQHLTEHDVPVDFVGYRDDLRNEIDHTWGSQAYLDPAFDRDHASRWGMLLGDMDVPIDTLMADHQPDVLVVLLGDNDLDAGVPVDDVINLLRDLVTDARAVDAGVKVALVTDPRPHLTPGAETYNADIADLVTELDTVASPVALADAADGYDENEDTYDGAHPNSHGELKIAGAIGDALSELGVGPPADRPLPLDTMPRGPRIPPVLSAQPTADGAVLTWVRSPGAQTSDVYVRDETAGEDWHRVAQDLPGLTYTVTGLPDGHVVELRTIPFKGFWEAEDVDAWSNVIDLTVGIDDPAPPPLGAVRGVTVRATKHGLRTAGRAVAGATSYRLMLATTKRCRRVPSAASFATVAESATPRRKVRIAEKAVWVRWIAVRGAEEGSLATDSTACVRLSG